MGNSCETDFGLGDTLVFGSSYLGVQYSSHSAVAPAHCGSGLSSFCRSSSGRQEHHTSDGDRRPPRETEHEGATVGHKG